MTMMCLIFERANASAGGAEGVDGEGAEVMVAVEGTGTVAVDPVVAAARGVET